MPKTRSQSPMPRPSIPTTGPRGQPSRQSKKPSPKSHQSRAASQPATPAPPPPPWGTRPRFKTRNGPPRWRRLKGRRTQPSHSPPRPDGPSGQAPRPAQRATPDPTAGTPHPTQETHTRAPDDTHNMGQSSLLRVSDSFV